MTIEEAFSKNSEGDKIDALKTLGNKPAVPPWSDLIKQYEPLLHEIFNKAKYPDKKITNDAGENVKVEPVTRVAVGLQKVAVKRMSEFMFTIPVTLACEQTDTDARAAEQFAALKKILKANRWNTLNKERCKTISSECEQATYWYATPGPNNKYGFKSNYKLKYATFSPSKGDELYPFFDESGDMLAFSRGFTVKENGKDVSKFETWTATDYRRWSNASGEWETEGEPLALNIGKIPVIYSMRPVPIWADADNGKVHELEKMLSQNGDILAYHAAPVLIIKGNLQGAPAKSEANKVFTTTDGGGAEYVSFQQSIESMKFQYDSLLRSYFMELQLPDLSFENVKGLGAVSGEARKWLLADAHLKVGDETAIYEETITRELSVICAFLGKMNTGWGGSVENLDIELTFNPFTISDESTNVDILLKANGNKPVVSQERSVELSGFSHNPVAEYKKIQAETEADAARETSPPGF